MTERADLQPGPVRAWLRRIPWHNWAFAGYYASILQVGRTALEHPPQSIEGAAGPILTTLWASFTVGAALIGLWGAIAPSIVIPWMHRKPGQRMPRPVWRRLSSPNFRMEQVAAVVAWLGLFIYASTVWGIVFVESQWSRQPSAWVITSHFWPFLIRLLYFRFREREAQTRMTAIAEVEARMRALHTTGGRGGHHDGPQ